MSTSEFRIRPAKEADSRNIWEWRNDPLDRAKSFSKDAIPWEVHQGWFATRLADSTCHFFVFELRGEAIGQLRVEVDMVGCGEIHIAVGRQYRAKGYAQKALILVMQELKVLGVKMLLARVKPDNVSSAVMFLKAGFQFVKCVKHKDTHCYELARNCP